MPKFVAVLGGQLGEMVKELFDLLASGVAERRNLTEVGGVAFDLSGVEVVLANEQAKAVAQPRLAIAGIFSSPFEPFLGEGSATGPGRAARD